MGTMRTPVCHRVVGLGAAVLLSLAGAGCSSIDPDLSGATGTSGATASSSPSDKKSDQKSENATPAFGAPIEWDGLTVTVSEPVRFSPTALASYPKGSTKFVKVDITVTNTSKELLQTMWLTTQARSGEITGFVADSDSDIGAPTTGIEPEQSLTWAEAYPMNGPLELTVAWQPPEADAETAVLNLATYPTPTPTATASTGSEEAGSEPTADATTEVTHVDSAG